jgi:hypothetical protein
MAPTPPTTSRSSHTCRSNRNRQGVPLVPLALLLYNPLRVSGVLRGRADRRSKRARVSCWIYLGICQNTHYPIARCACTHTQYGGKDAPTPAPAKAPVPFHICPHTCLFGLIPAQPHTRGVCGIYRRFCGDRHCEGLCCGGRVIRRRATGCSRLAPGTLRRLVNKLAKLEHVWCIGTNQRVDRSPGDRGSVHFQLTALTEAASVKSATSGSSQSRSPGSHGLGQMGTFLASFIRTLGNVCKGCSS